MASEARHPYRYLDSDKDRHALVDDIRRVRRDVLRGISFLPQSQWYEPRYHGWTPAALLAHLQLMDRLQMWHISAALLGINPHLSRRLLNRFNERVARIYQKREIEATKRGLMSYERKITDFILHLPMDKFSKPLYHPVLETTLTVEQALQEYFLYHWREHLQTIRMADDMYYEPPSAGNSIV